MAIDKKLQIFDDEGNPVDYDIIASDVKFNDGKDLPTKLAEMETQIGEAGSGDGTVKGVKVGSTPYDPDSNGVVDLSTPFNAKVDKVDGKGLSKNDYTDADKAKVDSLKTVATSGSYNDLTDKPNIPESATPDQSLDPNSDNAVSNAAVCAGLSSKANSGDVVKSISVNGTAQTKDGNGNVNVVVPTVVLDDAPTDGSPNGVKSGGIKAALDTKANAATVPTKTEMADAIDNALGEAEVTVVPANSVGIISSLGSDSNDDALSASMGKKLKDAVLQLYYALGTYAFPNGKPNLDFSDIVTCGVSVSVGTGLSASGYSSEVIAGIPLEVTIAITNNLYVVDDNSVVVTMGGTPVQGAWNANTMKVTIAAVTDDVVINIPSLTYVGYGEANSLLVSMFDGKNRGSVVGEWADVIDPTRKIVLTNCTEYTDHVYLDGERSIAAATSASTGIDVGITAGTIETVSNQQAPAGGASTYIFLNNFNSTKRLIIAGIRNNTAQTIAFFTQVFSSADVEGTDLPAGWIIDGSYTNAFLSMSDTRAYLNGVGLQRSQARAGITAQSNSRLGIFSFVNGSGVQNYRQGSLYCARVYSRPLTETEVLKNYTVDQKRFNLT